MARRSSGPRPGWTHLLLAACLGAVVPSGLVAAAPVAAAGGHTGSAAPPTWHVAGSGAHSREDLTTSVYHLSIAAGSAALSVGEPGQAGSFTLPLTALVGRAALPRSAAFRVTRQGARLIVTTVVPGTGVLVTATVTARPTCFTVGFTSQLGPSLANPVFFGGDRAAAAGPVSDGFTPDPEVASPYGDDPTATLGNTGHRYSEPFAPPPLDVELRTPVGWVGLGVTRVPDATVIGFRPGTGLVVNYPVGLFQSAADVGHGGRVGAPASQFGPAAPGTWVSVPSFVVTFASDPLAGLTAYDAALAGMGLVHPAVEPGHRPAWWSWPITDTWGQQFLVDGLSSKRHFTTAWVRSLVRAWRTTFGLQHFTVIIDAGWEAHLGDAVPDPRFGGIQGMRRLIDGLHAEGLRVVLWWPMWVVKPTSASPRSLLDPTAPGFAPAMRRAMRTLFGSGPSDLDADGIKYDWGYAVPQPTDSHFVDAGLGVGAAALLHYMNVMAAAIRSVRPGAMIIGEAAAPQFDGTENVVRLYDALLASDWTYRAELAAAAVPELPIDGDGFLLDRSQAVTHTVSSAVYGTPALYYATRWAGGQAIPAAEARVLGAVMSLSAAHGQGAAQPIAGGDWAYHVDGALTAESLDGNRALVIYRNSSCGHPVDGTLLSTVDAAVVVPIPDAGTSLRAVSAGGRAVTVSVQGQVATVPAIAGRSYQLTFASAACH